MTNSLDRGLLSDVRARRWCTVVPTLTANPLVQGRSRAYFHLSRTEAPYRLRDCRRPCAVGVPRSESIR